jgi:hypothetical protein
LIYLELGYVKMPKERTINPAQAQRKAEKAKAVKKGMLFFFSLFMDRH